MLGHVFARLRGLFFRTADNTVPSTSNVGPACPAPTTPTGSLCSAETTSHLPLPSRQRAKSAAKAKPVAAPLTAQEPLPAFDKVHVPTLTEYLSGVSGKPKAAAPRTRQPAKPALKQKPKAAKQASSGKKATRAKASAPTRTASRSGASGT